MDIYRVTFIGHRIIPNLAAVEDRLEELAFELLRQKEFVVFYVGHQGDFDRAVASAVKRAQKRFGHHNSELTLVLPYPCKDSVYFEAYYDQLLYPVDKSTHFKAAITRRNQWMMENADLLIAYVDHPSGGAHRALTHAQKRGVEVWNLANPSP